MAGNYKHGGAHTRLYNIWKSMRQRCINPKNSRYSVYGAKGIKVCKEWDDFKKFRDWAIKNGYEKNLTIDRIDNSKGYSPKNCRWVSYKIQANFESEDSRMSKAGNRYLRYYIIEATGSVINHCPEYKAFYLKKFAETRNHQHKRALALTSRKFIRLLFGLLDKGQLYSPEKSR